MTESRDELNYLSPDFNPNTITIPRLRSILVAHDIPYPSSAKKSQLIQLFKDNVTPRARSILAAQSRTKRSQRGITDVPSSQDDVVIPAGEDYPSSKSLLVTKSSKRGGRESLGLDMVEPKRPALATDTVPSKKQLSESRQITGKHGRASEVAANDQPASRRSRPSRGQQRQDQLDGIVENANNSIDESPFSTDNPFQRSSSPLAPEPIKEKRRKTDSLIERRQKQTERAPRRKATSLLPQNREYDVSVPSSKRFEPSVPSSTWNINHFDHNQLGPNPGEEFTPEEQEEVTKLRTKDKKYQIKPQRLQSKTHSYTAMKIAPWAITLAMIVGFGTVWRQEKLNLGYCGLETLPASLGGVHIPDWASFLKPQCEPCPQHAYCYPKLHTVCETGFVHVSHPLSLRGLIPLPPTCEPDTDAMQKIKRVADRAVESLRERNAKWECGELIDNEGRKIGSAAVADSELKEEISKKKKKGMSQSDFDDIWNNALGEILGRDEVTSDIDL